MFVGKQSSSLRTRRMISAAISSPYLPAHLLADSNVQSKEDSHFINMAASQMHSAADRVPVMAATAHFSSIYVPLSRFFRLYLSTLSKNNRLYAMIASIICKQKFTSLLSLQKIAKFF